METRPTSDRLRETLFNVLAPRLSGARFLDLYAGSGANGLEAVSRGAREAVLVEQAGAAVEAIRSNVAALGVVARVRVEQVAVRRWLLQAAQGRAPARAGAPVFEVIFLDPPYDSADEYTGALDLLGGSASGLLASGGVVVVEHRRTRVRRGAPLPREGAWEPADACHALQRYRTLEQGDSVLSFYALPGARQDQEAQP
jgi:16S rRNA (guanine966-N2)-methyltransferase